MKKRESLQFDGGVTVDAGEFSLFANEYGVIDHYGGICIKGTFTKSIPEFLKSGRILLDHDEQVFKQVGMPQSVNEKPEGLFINGSFHTTDEAQKARTITGERIANKKSCGVSVGFDLLDVLYISPADYDKLLPKYLSKEKYAEQRALADTFPYVYVRLEAELREASIVTEPANKNSHVVEVLSKPEALGKYLGEYIDSDLTITGVKACMDAFMWMCVYRVCWGELRDAPLNDKLSYIDGGLEELNLYIKKVCSSLIEDHPVEAEDQILGLFADPRIEKLYEEGKTGITFNTQLTSAIALLNNITSRAESIATRNRETLEGKMFSKINLGELKEIGNKVKALIEKAEPIEDLSEKEKEIGERLTALKISSTLN